jgi:DNA polymerase-3 subunit epsilon
MEVFFLIVAVCIFVVFYQRSAKQRAKSHAAEPPAILEQASQDLEVIKVPPPRRQPTLPSKVVFVDVETTGLTDSDRIVSFAAILLETQSLRAGNFTVSVIHVVCDPGKKSHPRAAAVHGFSDWVLRHQDPFSKYAGEIELLLDKADLIVAHNAKFDMNFINRELVAVGRRPPAKPIYCTMEGHRNLDRSGPASLTALASQIGLARRGTDHGALEDAWLAMMIYLDQHECPFKFPLESLPSDIFNLKACPPQPDGPLPRKKRKRTTASVESSVWGQTGELGRLRGRSSYLQAR